MRKDRYGKQLKNCIIGKGKEPVELKGTIISNSKSSFTLLIKEDEYSQLNKKTKIIPKSECMMEILDSGDYRVIIPMWLHDRLCK